MKYIAAAVIEDLDAHGQGGLPSVAAAEKRLRNEFRDDPELRGSAIYHDVPEHWACGDELGCDGHLVKQVIR